MKRVVTILAVAVAMLTGLVASATTQLLWMDNIRAAASAADAAKTTVQHMSGCQGLEDLLHPGASGMGISSSAEMTGPISEIRSHLNEIDTLAGSIRFTGALDEVSSAQEAVNSILQYKADVLMAIQIKLHFCGNGVEKL